MADDADHIWDMKDVGPGLIAARVHEFCRSEMRNEGSRESRGRQIMRIIYGKRRMGGGIDKRPDAGICIRV